MFNWYIAIVDETELPYQIYIYLVVLQVMMHLILKEIMSSLSLMASQETEHSR